MFSDTIIRCTMCGNDFTFSADEQRFFAERGFVNLPRRCKACKRAGTSKKPPIETAVVCAGCGANTTVPFKPTQGRPILCRTCFKAGRPR